MTVFTKFSMKNIAAVLILVALLFGFGMYSASTLKIETMPDITLPYVFVVTEYPGPPKDVVEQVTKPLEKALAGLPGIVSISSSTSDNLSNINIEFEQGSKLEDNKREVESQLANVKLPAGASPPKAATFGNASQPVFNLALSADQMTQSDLNKVYADAIEPGFNSLKGIDHVDSIGASQTQMDIKLDANALNQYGLTVSAVGNAISSALSSGPAGNVKFNGNSEMIRVTGGMDSVFALDNLELGTSLGQTLQLKQVAKISAVSESKFIARLDGKPTLGINLYKTKNTNTVEFSNDVQKLIKQWSVTQPNLHFKTLEDVSVYVRESIGGMVREGSLGAILASLMILVFLRNMRMTLIVLVSIPLSILITLILMAQFDITLNIMTLGGMAIAVGRVVDDSIVVIENIYAQLQKRVERDESVILFATRQVSSAITSSTLTTVGVFAPIGMVSGIAGQVFRPFAITLGCALLASLLVALTVIPLLAKLMVLNSGKIPHNEDSYNGRVYSFYKNILLWCLKRRKRTLLIAFLLFVVSLVATVPNLAIGFISSDGSDRHMDIQIRLPYETSLETTDAKVKELETILRDMKNPASQPIFSYMESLIGYANNGEQTPYMARISTELNEGNNPDKLKTELTAKITDELPKGSKVELMVYSSDSTNAGDDFAYSLKGEDQLTLKQAAIAIREKMGQFPELTDIKDTLQDTKQEVEVQVDQSKARLYGLTAGQIKDSVQSWVGETDLGSIRFGGVIYTTKIELDDPYKNSLESIGQMLISTPSGQSINLSDVAKIRHVDASLSISREKQEELVKLTAKINSKDKGGIARQVAAELDKIQLPTGVHREVSGVSDKVQQSFSQLYVAMAASIFIVYLIMILAFGNAGAPFAILFSLPLAAIGGLFGLLIMGQALDITSMIGFLMLIGIVVTNAIVLVDRLEQLKAQGRETREAVIEACMTRLRPIIMTAVATVFALLPLAAGLSKGTIISQGLADVVIGGLTTSTLLTLVVVPVVYEMLESFKARVRRLFSRKARADVSANSGIKTNP